MYDERSDVHGWMPYRKRSRDDTRDNTGASMRDDRRASMRDFMRDEPYQCSERMKKPRTESE